MERTATSAFIALTRGRKRKQDQASMADNSREQNFRKPQMKRGVTVRRFWQVVL